MLEKALRLCEAAHGHIWRIEGQHAYAVALRGDSQFIDSMRQESPAELVSERPLGRIARGEQVVHMPDATKERPTAQITPFESLSTRAGSARG
jgi:hypothetical protein